MGAIDDLERWMRSSAHLTTFFWTTGAVAVVAGSYMLAKYAGALVGLGLVFLIVAAAQQINRQIYPIGLLALKQLVEAEEGPLRR
jgi:hypothetical protein